MALTTAQLLKQAAQNVVKLTDGMEIRKVSNYVIDIFTGEGYRNHTRLQRTAGKWSYVRGVKLEDALINQAIQAI